MAGADQSIVTEFRYSLLYDIIDVDVYERAEEAMNNNSSREATTRIVDYIENETEFEPDDNDVLYNARPQALHRGNIRLIGSNADYIVVVLRSEERVKVYEMIPGFAGYHRDN